MTQKGPMQAGGVSAVPVVFLVNIWLWKICSLKYLEQCISKRILFRHLHCLAELVVLGPLVRSCILLWPLYRVSTGENACYNTIAPFYTDICVIDLLVHPVHCLCSLSCDRTVHIFKDFRGNNSPIPVVLEASPTKPASTLTAPFILSMLGCSNNAIVFSRASVLCVVEMYLMYLSTASSNLKPFSCFSNASSVWLCQQNLQHGMDVHRPSSVKRTSFLHRRANDFQIWGKGSYLPYLYTSTPGCCNQTVFQVDLLLVVVPIKDGWGFLELS